MKEAQNKGAIVILVVLVMIGGFLGLAWETEGEPEQEGFPVHYFVPVNSSSTGKTEFCVAFPKFAVGKNPLSYCQRELPPGDFVLEVAVEGEEPYYALLSPNISRKNATGGLENTTWVMENPQESESGYPMNYSSSYDAHVSANVSGGP